MSQLPLADATPLRIIGALFKDLAFAFEPQDIPDGARTLRTLRGNDAIIMDEVEDASIILVDPEHPGALDLLREAANKVVLHYSWVNKSLNAGHPLLESNNWGDCKVTPDNIDNDFGYVPPPPPSNLQLQTPRPTPENRMYNFSTPSQYSQGSAGITPPSSQPPYTPTPSHWNRDSVMLQQQAPQLPPTNQVAPYNSQPMQSPGMFSSFPMSQPAEMGTMVYGQQPPWTSFSHPGTVGMMQPPTLEDFRRAYEIMMWFQRPAMYQLPPPQTPTQHGPAFQPPPPPPTQNPPSIIGTQLEIPKVPETLATAPLSRRNSTSSNDILPDLGDPPGGLQPEIATLPDSPQTQPAIISPPSPPNDTAGPSMIPAPSHTYPKLFEHAVGKPIMFCVPIILKGRGRIAEIFRATGGGFTDDVEDADYVVLGQWEEHYFDEVWYSAQDYNKLTVTPAFVFDSYENGALMDPNNYPTRGPEKPRKDEPKRVRSRPATGTRKRNSKGKGGAGDSSSPSGEPPKWLRFFKEAENVKSLQYIGAMFKKNPELTHDALAIHLHNKMPSHTINSWKKYCLYHKAAIEDLRKRAISNAEKKAASKDEDATDMAGTGASETTFLAAQQDTPQQAAPQHPISRQVTPQQHALQQAISRQATPQQPVSQQPVSQQPVSQRLDSQQPVSRQVTPQQPTSRHTTPQQPVPQQAHQQPTNPHESQPPPPPYEKVANPKPAVMIKAEPMDEDQLDFAFAVEMLSGWNANEESDAALWKRMENVRPSATAPSWEAFCEKNRTRFEQFFARKSAQA